MGPLQHERGEGPAGVTTDLMPSRRTREGAREGWRGMGAVVVGNRDHACSEFAASGASEDPGRDEQCGDGTQQK